MTRKWSRVQWCHGFRQRCSSQCMGYEWCSATTTQAFLLPEVSCLWLPSWLGVTPKDKWLLEAHPWITSWKFYYTPITGLWDILLTNNKPYYGRYWQRFRPRYCVKLPSRGHSLKLPQQILAISIQTMAVHLYLLRQPSKIRLTLEVKQV